MVIFQDSTLGQLLKKIFIILVLGGVCAIVASTLVLYYFKPFSGFSADSILPSPSSIGQLSFSREHIQYVFDHVEFLYPGQTTGGQKRLDVNSDQYKQVFEMLSRATSLLDPPDHVRRFFVWDEPARLMFFARAEDGDDRNQKAIVFQEVQFLIMDNYFRIQVHREGTEASWAYFYYPDIYGMISKVLVSQS